MAVKRIDSIFDTGALQGEFDLVNKNLAASQAAIESLFATVNANKKSDIGGLPAATAALEKGMNDAKSSTDAAKKSNDDFVKSAVAVAKTSKELAGNYTGISSSLEENIKNQLRNKASLESMQQELKKLQKEYGNTGESVSVLDAKEKQLKETLEMFQNSSPSVKNKNAGAIQEIQDQLAALDKVKAANEEAAKSNDPLIQKQIELAKNIETVKQANTELQRSIRLQIKENNSATESIDQLKAQYDRLYQVFRGLSDAERGAEIGTELSADLAVLSKRINELQVQAGNYSSNIGRYAESLQAPFDMLTQKVDEIRANLAKGIGLNGGTDAESLTAAQQAIDGISGALSKAQKQGASTTVQVQALNEAFSVAVSTIGKGDSTETNGFLSTLGQQIGKAKQDITDFEKKTDSLTKVASNYAGNFANAFNVLESELSNVQKKLATTGKDTPGFEKLKKEEKLLIQLTENLSQVFKTPGRELKAFANAANALGLEFGKTSSKYEAFAREVGDAQDRIGDLKNIVNFNASDTKYLDGIVSAVNGLAGAYGVAESAQVLWGNSSEEMQKEMQKLQAILTLVTSLQQVLNAVQTDGAAVQVALAAKTALMNAARSLTASLSGAAAAAAQAEAAANAEVALSAGAATTALGAEAVSAEAATVALGTQAAAGEAAAIANTEVAATGGAAAGAMAVEAGAAAAAETATVGFATAFAATGIGALIIAVAAGVAYLVYKLSDMDKVNFDVEKSNKALADSLKDLNEAQIAYNNSMRETADMQSEAVDRQIAKQKEAGVNAMQSLALDKHAAEVKLENSKREVAINEVTGESVKDLQNKYEVAAGHVASAEKVKQKALQNAAAAGKELTDRQLKGLDDSIAGYKSEEQAAQSNYQLHSEIMKRSLASQQEVDILLIKEKKLAEDERRKLDLESARLEAELIMQKNGQILSDERSTQEQRVKAVKSNSAERLKIIAAELKAVQSDPTKRGTADETIAIKKASNDRIIVAREEKETVFQINETFRKRQLAAELEVNKIRIGYDVHLQEELINDQNQSLDTRLNALQKYGEDQGKLLLDQFEYTKATTIMTKDELLKLEADFHAKQVALAEDMQSKSFGILKAELEKENDARDEHLKDFQIYVEQMELLSMKQYNLDIQSLNKQYQDGVITYDKYLSKRNKLDRDYSKKAAQVHLDSLKTQLQAYEDHSADLAKVIDEIGNLEYMAAVAEDDVDKLAFSAKINRLKLLKKQYEDDAAARLKLEKEIAAVTGQLSKTTTDDKKADDDDSNAHLQKLLDGIQQSVSNVTQAISAIYDARAKEVQMTEDDQQRAYDREVDRINKTVKNEGERNEKLMALDAIRQDQKVQNENKLRVIEIQRAKFEKAANIANIITTTALAVVKALAAGGPFAIPLAISIGALGAVQLGIAISTPIPKFKHGKDGLNRYEGPGIVGDGGVPEFIHRADTGMIEQTPAVDTLVHVGKHDRIWSNKQSMMKDLGLSVNSKPSLRVIPIIHNGGLSRKDMSDFTNKVVDAVGNIRINETILTHRGWAAKNRRISETNAWIQKQKN